MTDKYDLSGIDALPAAPKPQSPVSSKYDLSAIDQIPASSGFDKTAALFTAAFGNPSEEAEKRRLSADIERITGTYAPVVDIADATRQRQQLQADHVTRASPRTSEFLSVPENAAVAIQDAKTMAQIEAIIGGDPLRSAEIAAKRFAMSAGALGAKVGFDFPAVATDIVGETLRAGGLPDNYNVFKDMSASARRQAVATRNAIEYFTPEARNMVERAAASAGESAGMSLQLLPLASATPQGAGLAAAFGITTFAESYTKAREAGKGPLDSLKYAIPQGAFEGLFEMAPAAFLADALKNAPGLKQFALGLVAKEVPTEIYTTLSQNLNDWVTFNPGKSVADFIAEQPEAMAETAIATIMGAGIQAGLVHGAQRVTGQYQQMQEERRTKQLQETLTSLFEEAKGVKSDPVTFQSFMAGATDNATVFINADALQETLAQNKIEPSALPSLAEQLAQPSVTGDVEVPIGELMTAFAGTPGQEQIVQHARIRQDDLSAAEQTKFGDMAAFFKKQGEAVAEKQKKNEVFTTEAREIEDDYLKQLRSAPPAPGRATMSERDNRFEARVMSAFYTVAADVWGVTPKQIRDGWTSASGQKYSGWKPNILGATDQAQPTTTLSQGFDHGNAMLNVGLDVGATDRAQQINADFVKAEIEKLGVQVLSAEEVQGEYEYEGKPVKELTYVPHLSRPLTEAEVNALAIATGQEAISQYDNGTGNLWGPNAAAWGAFNPEFFKDQAGTKLSDAQKELAQKKTKTPKITEIVKGQKLEQSTPLTAKQWADVRGIALEGLNEDEKTAWLQAEQEVLAGVEESNRNSDVLKEIAKTALDKMPVPRVSTVPLLAGRLKLKIEPTGNFRKDGTRKTRVPDVARALFNKFRNAKASVETPEGREIMARAMTHEALYALSQDGHAVGWYDRKVREAIMTFALVHPEVLTSPRHNLAFRLIAAITSNGQAVRDNFILANDIYNLWSKDQVFPTEFAFDESQTEEEVDEEETPPAEGFEGGGQRKPAMVAAFKKINVLVKELGWDAIESEMLQLRTVRDVEKEFGLKIGGENKDTVIPTAVGLGGPKIGNFFANLSGYFDSPTMDLWFMRTAGRMEGSLLETKPALVEHLDELLTLLPEDGEVKGQSVATLRKEIEKYKALDKEAQLDAETTLKTLKHVSIYARAQFSQFASPHPDTGKTYWDKSDANVNARRLVNNLAAVREAPSSGGERNNLRAVVTRAMELLEKQGISLTAADLQAVLWYHEKNLYSKLGDISASAKPWDYASAARFSVGRELGLVDVGSRQRAEAVPSGQPAPGGAGGLGAVRGLGQEDQGGALAQAVRSAGAVAGPVVGIHYSPAPRTSLASSMFGTGMKGAEAERLAASNDPRIKQRVNFYVNTGAGITPESDVGSYPHVATLRNLYDADADALKIWKNSKGDMNQAESAVLDAGFDGYLTRSFGRQGAVVMLGQRSLDVEGISRADVATRAEQPPSPEIPKMKQAAIAIMQNRALPNGQQSVESWRRDLERSDPDIAALIAWDKIPAGDYYKDEIAGALWQDAPALFAKSVGEIRKGSFSPITFELRFLEPADRSTFIHEASHFFMAAYIDMASQPDAPPQLKEFVENLLGYLFEKVPGGVQVGGGLGQKVGAGSTATGPIPEGRTNIERWNAMTLYQQRPYWEAFAEGFEQYTMTGKAPTKALQSAFNAFAKWMKEIYKTLKAFVMQHGTKPLDAELTQYFDRMLATDEELEAARAERGFQALFKNLAESGMSPSQFADYMALDDLQKTEAEELLRSRSIRDMKWLSNAKSKAIKELQAEADELRALVQASVEEELANTPIRQAERWLKKGEMKVGDDEIKAQAGHRLNMEIVKAMFPVGAIAGQIDFAKLGRGKNALASSTGTMHPDDMAALANEQFGGQFRNGEDLVRRLIDMPAFKDEVTYLTDLRMLEEHGDLATPEAIAKAADEAIHNDAHLRMVATEVWALGNRTGSVAALAKAAKAFAQNLVDNTVVKKLSPSSFANAATRAGKAAVRAIAKKDTDKAATEKRTEMVNAAAAKAAYAAEAEVRAIMTRLRKISAYSDKHSSVTSREFGVVQAVRAILSEFEIGSKGEKAAKYLKTLNEYDPTLGAVLDSTIESLAPVAKPWNQLKVAELRELHAAVTGLWRAAKEVRTVELNGEKMDLDAARARLLAQLEKIPVKVRESKAFSLTDAEKRNQKFQSMIAKGVRPETLFAMMDGLDEYGEFRQLIWNTVDKAQLALNTEKVARMKQLKALLEPVMSDMADVKIDAPELGGTFGEGHVIGYSELLHAILHSGNESNLERLLVGRGWGSVREDGALDTTRWAAFMKRMFAEKKITQKHMDFVQAVWDLLEELKPAAQAAHRATTGRYFPEIEAKEIVTPFGVYRGGYAPAIADRDLSVVVDMQTMLNDAQQDVMQTFEKPWAGFAKERTATAAGGRPLELNIAALGRHIDSVLVFSHMSVPIRNVQRVLKGDALAKALADYDKNAMTGVIAPWLHSAASQAVTDKGKFSVENSVIWTKLRSRAGMSLMFGYLANALQQTTGFLPAGTLVSKKEMLFAAAKGFYRPRELAASVAEMSPYMKQRLDDEVHALASELDEILLNPSKFESAQAWANQHAYFLQMGVDFAMSPIIWQARFNQTMAEGKDGVKEPGDLGALQQKAVDLADSAVRMSQGSNRAIDVASIEKGSPLYRVALQFAGWANSQANLLGLKLAREKLMPKTAAKYGRITSYLAMIWIAPAIVAQAIAIGMRGGPDDDEGDGTLDEWFAELLMAPVKMAASAVPFIGPALMSGVNAFNDKPYDDRMSISPVVSLVEAAGRGTAAAVGALEDPTKAGRAIRDIGSFLSLFGVPITPVTKAIGYATDVETGKVSPTGPVDYGRGIITGTASPESKR